MEKVKSKKVEDFQNQYSPGSLTQKYDDITQLVDLLERHNVPLDNFEVHTFTHLLNFIIHTAQRWDEQLVKMKIERDHYEADGVD